jgi:hypothetical protein
MFRIRMSNNRRKPGPNAIRGRLRPTLMEMERRELLSALTVSNTNDSGAGSLRAAVVQANSDGGGDTIVFSSLFSTPQTITLTSGQLELTGAATTTITGPGANLLSISGDNAGRVFDIASGSAAELSGLTVTDGKANLGGGIRNDGGTLELDQVVLRDNRARVGGGLYNNGSAALTDVVFRGNTAREGSGLFSTRNATLTGLGRSRRAATGTILNQTFNGTVSPPANWNVFLPGTVVQTQKTFLTMTDTSKQGAGILSNLSNVPFKLGGMTKITAQISSIGVKPVGNAIVGLLGPNGTAQPGELAAGIDGTGVVFIAEYDPAQKIKQANIVRVGTLTGYTGQSPVTMTVTIDSGGVQITAVTAKGTTKFRKFTFANDLNKFSLKSAFPVGAVPALVAASQQGQAGGAASFESINVSTA